MGKTSQPLTWAVPPADLARPEILALAEQGHTILPLTVEADIILSEHAHYWHPAMYARPSLLETVKKSARARRKERSRT